MIRIPRRTLLTAAAGGAALALTGDAAAAEPDPQKPPESPQEALKFLKEGNARFAAGKTLHAHLGADWRRHLTLGQAPFATILGCSDSRVPPELIFDQGLGDLFVVRVAGNVIASDVVGSLIYAAVHLKTRLFVVLGHQGCGAVTAAVEAIDGGAKEPPGIAALLELIKPALAGTKPGAGPARVAAAVEANVRWSMRQLAALPNAAKAFESGQLLLAGAVYELDSGRVRFLSE